MRKWTDQPEKLDHAVELLSFHDHVTFQIGDLGAHAGAERYSVTAGNLFGSQTRFFDTLPAALIFANDKLRKM
jgi:hypothetical protein